jgi:hypothetical protein
MRRLRLARARFHLVDRLSYTVMPSAVLGINFALYWAFLAGAGAGRPSQAGGYATMRRVTV